MELELSGRGYLEYSNGNIYSVSYDVRSHREWSGLYRCYGRIEADEPGLLLRLMMRTKNLKELQCSLMLDDGTRLPISLISPSGEIEVMGIPQPSHA